eukprot:scaffold25733_cov67-Phaeocystis_antarctica.AAC.2
MAASAWLGWRRCRTTGRAGRPRRRAAAASLRRAAARWAALDRSPFAGRLRPRRAQRTCWATQPRPTC